MVDEKILYIDQSISFLHDLMARTGILTDDINKNVHVSQMRWTLRVSSYYAYMKIPVLRFRSCHRNHGNISCPKMINYLFICHCSLTCLPLRTCYSANLTSTTICVSSTTTAQTLPTPCTTAPAWPHGSTCLVAPTCKLTSVIGNHGNRHRPGSTDTFSE